MHLTLLHENHKLNIQTMAENAFTSSIVLDLVDELNWDNFEWLNDIEIKVLMHIFQKKQGTQKGH